MVNIDFKKYGDLTIEQIGFVINLVKEDFKTKAIEFVKDPYTLFTGEELFTTPHSIDQAAQLYVEFREMGVEQFLDMYPDQD